MIHYEELNAGWLSPTGELWPCDSYEHNGKAREILQMLGYIPHYPDDELMDLGWVHIGISNFFRHEWRIYWDEFLTDYQINFLKPYFEESDLPVNESAVRRWKREVHNE